jgi:hypothetical protein
MTDRDIPGAGSINGLPTRLDEPAVREILAAAFDLRMPGKSDPVRIRSEGFIRPDERRIPYNVGRIPYRVDGVMRTTRGLHYWCISGCWYTDASPMWNMWCGYSFEFIGRVVAPPLPSTHPFEIPVRYPGRPDSLRVEVWRQRAHSDGSSACSEIVWQSNGHPEGSDAVLPTALSRHDRQVANRGLRLLRMLSMKGRPQEDQVNARRRLLAGALDLKRQHWAVERESLARTVPGVTTVDGIADLLRRAGWSIGGKGGKPSLKDLTDTVDMVQRQFNLDRDQVVHWAEQAAWDRHELERLPQGVIDPRRALL